MTKPERGEGRGQLHKRGARAWRDQENPTGPGQGEEPEIEADQAGGGGAVEQIKVDEPVNAGPGGGGATESGGRANEHAGVHGGPTRKP